MGGLALCNPSGNANFEFDSSIQVASSLTKEIIEQQTCFRMSVVSAQRQAKADVIALRHRQLVCKQSKLTPQLPASLRRIVSLSSERGGCKCTWFLGSCHQKAFFDVRIFNPTAPSYQNTVVSSLYRRFERDKQRMYE